MGYRTKNGAYTGQRSDGVAILSLSIGQVEFEGWVWLRRDLSVRVSTATRP